MCGGRLRVGAANAKCGVEQTSESPDETNGVLEGISAGHGLNNGKHE
jgi:hypothetical protein